MAANKGFFKKHMTTLKKVSIIIPTRNRVNYLERTIHSALMQDYANIEIIITDNASSDNTEDVVKKYLHDKKVKYFRNNYNIGMAANWNKALMKYASGKYVMLLPDDDRLVDNSYISEAMELIDRNLNVVLVFANYQEVDLTTGEILRKIKVNFPPIFDGRWFWIHYWENRDGINGIGCPQLTTLYSRNIAKEVGGYFLDVYSPDTLLVLHILLHGKVGFIPNIVAEYGIHASNASKETDGRVLYSDLQYIRSSAEYSMDMGLKPKEVERWKNRLMIFRMRHICSIYFRKLLNGNLLQVLEFLGLVRKNNDMKYLVYSILEIFYRKFKKLVSFRKEEI